MAAKRRGTRRAPHAYDGLNRIVHEKARLGILTALVTRADGIRFVELKDLCSLTDGNLSRHVQVLQEAGLVDVWKGQEEGRSQTLIRLSRTGRAQFLAYLEELERVIRDAREGVEHGRDRGMATPPGWSPA